MTARKMLIFTATKGNFFYKTQRACVKLIRFMSIFTSNKVWKFLIKNQLTKSDPKRIGGGNCSPSCQLGLTLWYGADFALHIHRQVCSKIFKIMGHLNLHLTQKLSKYLEIESRSLESYNACTKRDRSHMDFVTYQLLLLLLHLKEMLTMISP